MTLKLGTHHAGKVLDFTQLYQAKAKLGALCAEDSEEFVCSGVSAKIEWDPAATPPTFYSKPAQ